MSGEESPTRTDWNAVEALFAHAVELAANERGSLLHGCADQRIRAAVLRLLERHDRLERKAATNPLATLDSLRAATLVLSEELAPGTMLDRYRIVCTLGEGSMGTVYQATDSQLGRDVALKVLAPYLGTDPLSIRRFRDEARIAASLDDPHVASIHEIGATADGGLFIAMVLCAGGTLRDRLAGGPLPVEDVIRIGAQLAAGLGAAHAAGIVHRDVKPENILFGADGAVRIADFGIAKIAGRQLTRTGMTLGTAAYMSPEQTRGEAVDHRTDLWSLGVVLYEMITGVRPFACDAGEVLIASIRGESPRGVTIMRRDAPVWLARLIEHCLEKSPASRPSTARDIGGLLERYRRDRVHDPPE